MNYIISITVPESELVQYLPLWPIKDEGKLVRMTPEQGIDLAAMMWLQLKIHNIHSYKIVVRKKQEEYTNDNFG